MQVYFCGYSRQRLFPFFLKSRITDICWFLKRRYVLRSFPKNGEGSTFVYDTSHVLSDCRLALNVRSRELLNGVTLGAKEVGAGAHETFVNYRPIARNHFLGSRELFGRFRTG